MNGVRVCYHKVVIGNNHMMNVVGYGTLTVALPGNLDTRYVSTVGPGGCQLINFVWIMEFRVCHLN